MKFRKLLATHVLNDELRFRGHGVHIEGECFLISLGTCRLLPAFNSVVALIRTREVQLWWRSLVLDSAPAQTLSRWALSLCFYQHQIRKPIVPP